MVAERKKVLMFLPVMKPGGGAHMMAHIANGLVARGCDVELVAPRGRVEPLGVALEAPVRELGLFDGGSNLLFYTLNFMLLPFLSPRADVYIGGHGAFMRILSMLARLKGGRAAAIIQGNDFTMLESHEKFRGGLKQRLLKWFINWNYRARVTLFANSEYTAGCVRRNAGREVEAIINPDVDGAFFAAGAGRQAPAACEKVKLFAIGRKHAIKGMGALLAVLGALDREQPGRFRLTVACIDPVTVPPGLPVEVRVRPGLDELAGLYRDADIFIFISTEEGFGAPPVEAMAAGTPVVMTDSGGVREYARPGDNCVMPADAAPETVARAVISLADDPEFRAKLSRVGRAEAQRFKMGESAKKIAPWVGL